MKAIPHRGFIQLVALVRQWLDAAGITEGPLFRPVSRSGRVRGLSLTGEQKGRADKLTADIVAGATVAASPRLTTQAVADIVKRHTEAIQAARVLGPVRTRGRFVLSARAREDSADDTTG